MELQRQSDQKRVLDFVRECCAIRDPEPIENFFGRLVGALSRMVPCLHVTYNEVNPATMEFSNIGSTPESSGAKVEKLLEMYLREHPWLIRYMGTGDGRAGRVSDCLSRRQFQDTGLYGGFYRQYDIEDDLCLIASAALRNRLQSYGTATADSRIGSCRWPIRSNPSSSRPYRMPE